MNHRPRKRFGQNFLHDPGIIQKIIRAIDPGAEEHLVEIGPGQGAITLELLRHCGAMHAIELDRDLIEPLRQQASGIGELVIHNVDALKFDFRQLNKGNDRLRIIGNLPYNISTPILFHLIGQLDVIQDMHFMLQKEVVDRMAAPPGSKTYGRLSVMLQARCRIQALFDIGPGAFRPPPKVDSAFVRLTPLPQYAAAADTPLFARLVAQAFSQRRKTLRNSLREYLPATALEHLDIPPGARPESLSVEDFLRIAEFLSNS